MLVRTFRVTDKFSNALLRLIAWIGQLLLDQAYRLRLALVKSLEALWFTLTQTIRSGRVIYQNQEERRSALMARRVAEGSTRPAIREDPLKTQNRALSMFTVVLMASLLLIVLWFTAAGQAGDVPPRLVAANGSLPLQTRLPPTAFPTTVPTNTAVPDPLSIRGSIVYTQRENGKDNLWVMGIGQSTPMRLTDSSTEDRDPAWSPDGNKIAFASHRDGNWELYVMDVSSGTTNRLTYDLDYKAAPTWSPDGKFIAYEAYKNNNLDIYIIASDGSSRSPIQLTHNPAPDFSPAWSPDGRHIAYVSLRDGNQEIYIINLARPSEDEALRLTNTPDIDEDHPTWSPDGQTIAYSARVTGIDLVLAKPVAKPDADAVVVGQGREPTWAPNGASLLFAVDNGPSTMLIGAQVGTVGAAALAISLPAHASHPHWSNALLPSALTQGGGLRAAPAEPLYKEVIAPLAQRPPFSALRLLQNVKAPNPYLADKVDDSFIALRQMAVREGGFDFLGTLKDALWGLDHVPGPGETRMNWHYAGRAFDFDRNLVFNDPAPIEVVREDSGVNTYWRVYVRVPDQLQGGQLGAPLKQLPWDFASRSSGDPQAFEEGGRKKAAVPSGYYVDFTQLAEDYGWTRIPSERTWRSVYSSILYWEFDKRENLSWNDAMLDLYSQEQIDAFMSGPTFVPTPQAPPSETPQRGPTKTSTPIPPA